MENFVEVTPINDTSSWCRSQFFKRIIFETEYVTFSHYFLLLSNKLYSFNTVEGKIYAQTLVKEKSWKQN